MLLRTCLVVTSALTLPAEVGARWTAAGVPNPSRFPDLDEVPPTGPVPPPDYMVSNQFNIFGAAPDNGTQNGPVWDDFGGVQGYMRSMQANFSQIIFDNGNWSVEDSDGTYSNSTYANLNYAKRLGKRQGGGFWLTELGPLGKAPVVETPGYKFWRNVKDYGAKGDGTTDDTKAINAAVSDGARCGLECGNTFAMGAIVYFPPGTYKVSTPIIQLYYTEFIGDPLNRPIIKGSKDFKGIGLIDTDVYIPGESGKQWYINQNQFFRQIRNFEFDLTEMPEKTDDDGQPLVPTGIHWQVSQATSLQNLKFTMPRGDKVTHVGIFTENGSGGFVSDLEFEGGNIGWRVGNQQYTARGLKFNGCTTAVQMIWDWGFNWQQIEINGGAIGFNITGKGGDTDSETQGTGSISIIDSKFSNVPIGVLTSERDMAPNIVIDNLELSGVGIAVKSEQGNTLLAGGSTTVKLWGAGRRYKAGKGSYEVGPITGAPERPAGLLSGGKLFVKSRPQFESLGAGAFLVATQAPYNLRNDATGDQTAGLNRFLADAAAAGKVAYFPAGIYLAEGTVKVPIGSRLQGSSWSQIMCTGPYFNDMMKPKVFIEVGNKGQRGSVEIVEMMFTAKGPTAGAVMVEWNVEADAPGSAGMWDTHIRVGGAKGSDLDFANCPKRSENYDKCTTTSMLLHITSESSGYFENMWAWVADHDNDMPISRQLDSSSTQISLFAARGILIESTKPTWLYGTGSEHVVLYQYQLYKAKNVFLGHIQTEAPYFQPLPAAPAPFTPALGVFPGDPTFKDCTTATCRMAWGVRLIDSSDIYFHSMGLYSWFNHYTQYCVKREDCQQKILDIRGKAERIAMYNLFTKASIEMGSGGPGNTIYRNDSNQNGYTGEVSAWFPGDGTASDDIEVVYLGPEVYEERTAYCTPPCLFVLPPSPLPEETEISIPPYTTSLEVGRSEGESFHIETVTIVVYAPNITTDQMPMSNVNVTAAGPTGGDGDGIITIYAEPSLDIPPISVMVQPPWEESVPTPRVINLPPWPKVTGGPPAIIQPGDDVPDDDIPDDDIPGDDEPTEDDEGILDRPRPGFGPPMVWDCPPSGVLEIDELHAILTLDNCQGQVTLGGCLPTKTKGMNAPPESTFVIGCTLFTGTQLPDPKPFPTGSGSLQPIDTPVPDPPKEDDPPEDSDSDDDEPEGVYLSCKAWFFFICIDWPELKVFGWVFPPLPPGPYRSGPPGIDWPKLPGITVKGKLPKWPTITIPTKGPIPTPEKPSNCKTETAELCKMTTSYGGIVEGGTTRTTTSTVKETCATIFGCELEDDTSSTETFEGCTVTPVAKRDLDTIPTPSQKAPSLVEGRAQHLIQARAKKKPCDRQDAIIIPQNPEDVQAIRDWLGNSNNNPDKKAWEYQEIKSERAKFTGFFYIVNLDRASLDKLAAEKQTHGIDDVYFILEKNAAANSATSAADGRKPRPVTDIWQGNPPIPEGGGGGPAVVPRHLNGGLPPSAAMPNYPVSFNGTLSGPLNKRNEFMKHSRFDYWELSQLSAPPQYSGFQSWKKMNNKAREQDKSNKIINTYWYPQGTGPEQYVYNLETDFDTSHAEFQGLGARLRRTPYTSPYGGMAKQVGQASEGEISHGTAVSSKIIGNDLGAGRDVIMVLPVSPERFTYTDSKGKSKTVEFPEATVFETFLRAMDDILDPDNKKEGRAVINYSAGVWTDGADEARMRIFHKIIKKLGTYNVLVVAAVHNDWKTRGDAIDVYPAAWADVSRVDYLSNVLAVGAVQQSQRVATFAPFQQWVTYAPGEDTYIAVPGKKIAKKPGGSSMAAPLVAAMAANLRSLPSKWKEDLKNPRILKALIKQLSRPLPMGKKNDAKPKIPDAKIDTLVKTAWNGQVFDIGHCLLDTTEAKGSSGNKELDKICGTIEDIKKADSDRALLPANGGGQTGGGESGIPIEHKPGPAGPLCDRAGLRKRAGQCGKLCTGFYCTPTPVGFPPDYHDPEDPAHKITSVPLPTLTGSPDLGDCPKTTSRQCIGSGGRETCQDVTICRPDLPSLTGNPDLGDCPKTTSRQCVGTGGRQSCVDVTICAPTIPTPTAAPVCDDACQDRKKLDAGNACNCNRNGCDANSPKCCYTSSCRSCQLDCPEDGDGCTPNSPACCGSGSCKWNTPEWTTGQANWGTCRIHIHQHNWFAAFPGRNPMLMEVSAYINDGPQRAYAAADTDFGRKMTWAKASSKFPTDIEIDIRKESGAWNMKKRDRPAPGEISANERLFMSFDLYFTAGGQRWSSGNRDESRLPFCRVGAWDKYSFDGINQLEPNRQMDCYWSCG
ncbi:pectate lyase superfamily protein-domain-containing protein [Cercophora samala]|uniref:Pectate lyase superfamily protein-domain-containing protein n=1 Tax=Cercophora samala TaxID=330535 RepID=A0AA39ZLF4_9PEZI|nr:pectate lyase superfamily protein-domain-containing protein [Cercophora samala]